MLRILTFLLIVVSIELFASPKRACAQGNELPVYLRDRGTGLPTSMFGTYIRQGELLVFPFFEYSIDNNREYQPDQFGLGPNEDFLARYQSTAGQLFMAYGLTDWLAIEFEAAYMNVTFEKSPDDLSETPARIKESGLGDVEGQLRIRWLKESEEHLEIFSFLEITAPSQKNKLLIGDKDWDFKPGIGLIRGFSWGTIAFKTDLEYNRESSNVDIGETTVEYLKRLSPSLHLYLGIEGGEGGAPDEWDLIAGLQWRIADFLFLKFDNALGVTPKATDWAPQIGSFFSFPVQGR
jgi:hypothetical protein